MARVIFGSYFFRYPLGGMMSHVLQYLVGFQRLGHEVTFVERATYPDACFDPVRNLMSNDCTYGMAEGRELLGRFDLEDRWCFVDYDGRYHGLGRKEIEDEFAAADVFFDMGTHGAWLNEASASGLRVMIDGEPGFNQIKMERGVLDPDRAYDLYFTNGRNVGTDASTAPTAGRPWNHLFHPVVADLFDSVPPPVATQPFTTVMNWQSHEPIEYSGQTYGQKDIEFAKFIDLPRRVQAPLEIAVAGQGVPRTLLERAGWIVEDAQDATISYDAFVAYISGSQAEFSVAKNVFVAMNTGWFSDRSAVYLATGRPVIIQDTGFGSHLPTGEGLFAVSSAAEAAEAVEAVAAEPQRHSTAARRLASTYLDTGIVLSEVLARCGID